MLTVLPLLEGPVLHVSLGTLHIVVPNNLNSATGLLLVQSSILATLGNAHTTLILGVGNIRLILEQILKVVSLRILWNGHLNGVLGALRLIQEGNFIPAIPQGILLGGVNHGSIDSNLSILLSDNCHLLIVLVDHLPAKRIFVHNVSPYSYLFMIYNHQFYYTSFHIKCQIMIYVFVKKHVSFQKHAPYVQLILREYSGILMSI